MKAKVIIENGETTIVLTPENGFEIEIINAYEKDKAEQLPRAVVCGSSTYSYNRPKTYENGKCNHLVVFEGADGYVRCGYCRSIIDDMTNYR